MNRWAAILLLTLSVAGTVSATVAEAGRCTNCPPIRCGGRRC
jgi:hypothetical protein